MQKDVALELRLLVTGGHLVGQQGMTTERISLDGFRVDEQVENVLASDTPVGVAKSLALGIAGYAEALNRIDPDLLLVLGDRYEALGVAITAALRLLPIAHISGGELTYGATDDSVRHAITKLAALHFTSTEEFRSRVIQLGEDPERVFNVGAPGLDNIRTMAFLSQHDTSKLVGVTLKTPVITVTYHPATADPQGSGRGLRGLLAALDRFPDVTIIFTGTNIDQHSLSITKDIEEYVRRREASTRLVSSLGQAGYLSLLKISSAVVGNSSSGIYEAPAVGTPTVNIGSRQDGRPRAKSVIDCGEDEAEIAAAIDAALRISRDDLPGLSDTPYGDGYAADRIVHILKTVNLKPLSCKKFFDLPDSYFYMCSNQRN
ncbi:UDP-N-acetylglucosamine 2-epimerase (non-hydrolyzing)/GDP/UDP-N,N'-diacetylbacillosamine 2-epimerase (hydrolyzing) [Amycolatopsis bartoniae]|nr:UDP-N-acetylglucosamine 2-epimerase (non-hydrolyzing)/GDP/UDP-N,N'-diacetylbacillosamine 2-epimerase (hydrolyzing) [Amycolatopsis bartoniae]